jgi:hypothetical protein
MGNTLEQHELPIPEQASISSLRRKIGWLCELIRWLIVVWLAWQLYLNLSPLIVTGAAASAAEWTKYWGLAEGAISPKSVYFNRGFSLTAWLAAAIMGVAVWRLMSGYLEGDIMSARASDKLRLVGLTALVSATTDIVVRPFMLGVLSNDIIKMIPLKDWVEPRDMLYFLIAMFVLSLGHIQKTAAVISDEHKQFV